MAKNNQTESTSADSSKLSCVGYLGPEGTFTHQAALILFGDDVALKGTDIIEDVFELVEKGECDQGVVPVENSYEGSVGITLDLFNRYQPGICAEFYLKVIHNLLSSESNISGIKRIYSHPQAVAQCRRWLRKNLPGIPLAEVSSTSYAAKLAATEPETGSIGSRFAAETYNLNILSKNIEDNRDNVTRFLVIGNKLTKPTGSDKTSILFLLKHEPGALYKCLSVLAERKVNMTRIESRPVKTKSWEYLFFVDLEGHKDEVNIREALQKMEAYCVFMKILGSYPCSTEVYGNR
ncbi:prephenate dehydratase [Thermodesulfobacteriota bacterium]